MSTTLETALLLAGGATGTEIVRYALNFRRDRRRDDREGDQVEFQQITDLNKQAAELRDEMRRWGRLVHSRLAERGSFCHNPVRESR